jgi:uncharacterized protein (TIGR02646 family)
MRRISKTRPPRNVYPEGKPSFGLQEALVRLRASLATLDKDKRSERARNEFDDLDKKKLREVLYAEQRHLCVYCERRVKEVPTFPPIEHWRPLSVYPDLALEWKNLYLSCASDDTCDETKKSHKLVWNEADDDDLPWPSETSYEEWIGFTTGGDAYVRADAPCDEAKRKALKLAIADQDDGGRKRKSLLNLNSDTLREARKAAIDAERARMERAFPGKTATASDRQARVDQMLNESMYPEFVSIRVLYLKRLLGKNTPP